jgi:CxxC motif-containing protein (DUF1111 family)
MKHDTTTRLYLAALLAGGAGIAIAVADPAAERPDLDPPDYDRIAAIVAPTTSFDAAEAFEANPGGATTTPRRDRDAFSQPSQNLDFAARADFTVGDGVFRQLWVSAPASTTTADGLGPLFNARACQECHIKDGRGHPPALGATDAVSFLLALSYPPGISSPYGHQLEDFATNGMVAEGRVEVEYTERTVAMNGGEVATLRVPHYSVADLGYGPLPDGTVLSPRIAPPMIGLGLLEAIHPNDIIARADPDDADGDGISGRISWVTDYVTGESVIGRFGWRASQPSVANQTAVAFANDMGLGTGINPLPHGDCTELQADCLAAPIGADDGEPEVAPQLFDLVVFYARHLAVPARSDYDDPEVLAGKQLFYDTGCTSCHTPKYVTSNDPGVAAELRRQLIWPYTDLLLHDMGEGLADGSAGGYEWRTAPLWGIGLTDTVNGEGFYLHDGRARTLLEAVLWHGGEAAAARNAVVDMAPEQRAALIRFLESL